MNKAFKQLNDEDELVFYMVGLAGSKNVTRTRHKTFNLRSYMKILIMITRGARGHYWRSQKGEIFKIVGRLANCN